MNKSFQALIILGLFCSITACLPQSDKIQNAPDATMDDKSEIITPTELQVEATPIPTEDPHLKTVRIGILAYPEYAPWALALDENNQDGAFSVQLRVVANEQEAVDELLAGRIDLAVGSDRAILKLAAKHDELRLTTLQSVYTGFSVMARKGESRTYENIIKKTENKDDALTATIHQFKGRYILVPGGTAFHPELEAVLQMGGMDLKSIFIVNMEPEPGARAFLQGSAAYFSDGIKQRIFLEENGAQNIITASDLGGATLQFSGLFTTREFLEENPEALENTLDVWYRSLEKMKNQPDETNEQMAAWLTEKTGLSYQADELSQYQERKILVFPNREDYADVVLSENGKYYWLDRFTFLSDWLVQQGEIESETFDFSKAVTLD